MLNDVIVDSDETIEQFPRRCLIVPVAISAVLFFVFAFQGPITFQKLVTLGDTGGYTSIAWDLLKSGKVFPESVRTIGYPLYLVPCYLIGGETYGSHFAIALQLLLNLLFLPLTWYFLFNINNQISRKIRLIVVYLVWFTSLGLAIVLLSDFLASLLFNIFLFGFCFRRSRSWILLAGMCLIFAILTRPVFNFTFLLIPFLAFLVQRFGKPISLREIGFFVLCSIVGWGINASQEQYSRDVKGSMLSIKEFPVMLWYSECMHNASWTKNQESEYKMMISNQTGKPYDMLTRYEKESTARKSLINLAFSQPKIIAVVTVKRFIKTLFAPVDSVIWPIARLLGYNEPALPSLIRAFLFILCLPLWLLPIIPGKQLRIGHGAYYIFTIITIVYVVGLTALLADGGGERYRLPLLMIMFTTVALQMNYLVNKNIKKGNLEKCCEKPGF